ncbi:MAG: YgiT-type zinc finger protein [Anaerolineae bacterium]|nr:YgiT-type zinc finger protein [Anaerolineae bacterium]
MAEERFDPTFSCRECQAGQMRRRYVTYFTWMGDELITVPDFPAWVCDVCGRREYDPRALNHLSLLLSPNAGKPAGQTEAAPSVISRRTKKQVPPPGDVHQ